MTDDDLLGYAWFHCRTERALFHKNHVRRILELAGKPIPEDLEFRDFWSVPVWTMQPLLDAANALLKESNEAPVPVPST